MAVGDSSAPTAEPMAIDMPPVKLYISGEEEGMCRLVPNLSVPFNRCVLWGLRTPRTEKGKG